MIPVYYGAEIYYIQAKSQESSNMVLKRNYMLGLYGYDLIQSCDIYDYDAEWSLEEVRYVNLIGIASDCNHTNSFAASNGAFISNGFVSAYYTPTSITSLELKNYLINSDVIIFRSSGGYDSIGTYMYLNETATTWFHSWDIYNYNGNSGINMNDCEVAVFAGPQTANHETQSLPESAVNAGADIAIGFKKAVLSGELELWTERFSRLYASGTAADESAYSAAIFSGSTANLNSVTVKYHN